MEEKKETPELLDLIIRPGFYVKENKITGLNAAARGLLLSEGMDIRPLICSGLAEYEAFTEGCLYLRLNLICKGVGACVTRSAQQLVFVLEPEESDSALQVLSLAARELREPLTALMASAGALQATAAPQLAQLNRGLHQLLRLVGNMSDAGRAAPSFRPETTDVDGLFAEVIEKAAHLAASVGVCVTYQGLGKPVFCLADRDQLERAVLNLISNALKFVPAGGRISVTLSQSARTLRLSVCDDGPGIPPDILGNVFTRYLRQPCLEDSRFGLGLGMVLVRSVAANHGGAVLIDQPEDHGTRVTMTMAIRQNPAGTLRSPVMRVDYTGERDHALVELADCLPAEWYKKET